MMAPIAPKPRENVWLWLAKLVTGALVFTLIIVHIIVNHLVSSNGLLSYADVVAYLSNPWIALMESCFVVIVVAHALLGLRSVLLDLNPNQIIMRVIDWGFGLVGVAASVYGIWLIQVIIHSAPSL
jgi:succinate dehydrogenase hydrophobic anchor subunit